MNSMNKYVCNYCDSPINKGKYCNKKCFGKHLSITRKGENNPFYGKKHTKDDIIKRRNRFLEDNPMKHKDIAKKFSLSKIGSTTSSKGKSLKEIYGDKSDKVYERLRNNGITTALKGPKSDTLPERLVENYLLFNDILYVKQFRYKLGVVDFWLPEDNIILEVDGDYWHSRPEVKRRDYLQTKYFKSQGYEVFRLKELDIKNNIEGCLSWIQ